MADMSFLTPLKHDSSNYGSRQHTGLASKHTLIKIFHSCAHSNLGRSARQGNLIKFPSENAGASEEIFRENSKDFTWSL
jgi:hypothetical protein